MLRSERYYGSAYRSLTLPTEVDEAASEAKYDNGVLKLYLGAERDRFKPPADGKSMRSLTPIKPGGRDSRRTAEHAFGGSAVKSERGPAHRASGGRASANRATRQAPTI